MIELDQEVIDNYTALKAERGLSWEQLATQVPHDSRVAAWLRSNVEPERIRTRTRRPTVDA